MTVGRVGGVFSERQSIMVVLALAFLLTAGSVTVASAAPRLICYTVHRGETAAEAAARLTGNPRSVHEPWFQFFDPPAARFIPKSQYRQIRRGWYACISEEMLRIPPRASSPELAWWWVPIVCFAGVLAWSIVRSYASQREATVRTLEQFGTLFIREFERPLIEQSCPASPLRSRLRIIAHRERVEVLLAPNTGRRYPNLSDHRKNVEYDVERVVTLLGDQRFVCGQLGIRGQWVVIPFRLEAGSRKEGSA
jgi:hypothetical protein